MQGEGDDERRCEGLRISEETVRGKSVPGRELMQGEAVCGRCDAGRGKWRGADGKSNVRTRDM